MLFAAALLPLLSVSAWADDEDAGEVHSAYEEFPNLDATRYIPRSETNQADGSGRILNYVEAKEALRIGLISLYENGGNTLTLRFKGKTESSTSNPGALSYYLYVNDEYVPVWAFMQTAYYNTIYEYPEALFFAKTGYAESNVSYKNGTMTVLFRPLFFTKEEMPRDIFGKAFEQVLDECFGSHDTSRIRSNGMSELEYIVAAHDWISANCIYDPYVHSSHKDYQTPDGTTYTWDETIYTPYGAFVNRKAVCQGYALAFNALMARAGVYSFYTNSDEMRHAWNMVQLGGTWYHVDATWDDPIWDIGDVPGSLLRNCLLLSDSEIRENYEHHDWYNCGDFKTGSDSYPLSEDLKNSVTPVHFYNGKLYLCVDNAADNARTDESLKRYALGNNFTAAEKTVSLYDDTYEGAPLVLSATALDRKSGDLYVRMRRGDIYAADLTKETPTISYVGLGADSTYGLQIAWHTGYNVPIVYDVYKYDIKEFWYISLHKTANTMAGQLCCYSGLLEDKSRIAGGYVRFEKSTDLPPFYVCQANYSASGKMLGIFYRSIDGDGWISLVDPGDADTVKIFVIDSASGAPLSMPLVFNLTAG